MRTDEDDQDWTSLATRWRELGADLEISDQDLQARLRRQRLFVALGTCAEVVSLLSGVGIAIWMSRNGLIGRPGLVLIGWLLLQAVVALWMRRRQATVYDESVLDRLDANIEHDRRIVESMRLANLMGSLALAAMILGLAFPLLRESKLPSATALVSGSLLLVYVFTVQSVIIAYARRVKQRRKFLEEIRVSLRSTEQGHD